MNSMGLKTKSHILSLSLALVILSTLVGIPATPVGAVASVVKVTGSQGNGQLTVNGQPYLIKGGDFGPSTKSTAATLDAYTRDMGSLGGKNTRPWGAGGGAGEP